MRGGENGGEQDRPRRGLLDRVSGDAPAEACCRCRREFELATMTAWRDGMWCVGCAKRALEGELQGVLRARLRADREAARQRGNA
jgi:hypothetical protein